MKKKSNDKEIIVTEKQMMDALMEYIPDSIYFKDLQSRVIRVNKACAKGAYKLKNSEESIGKTDFDFFSKEHANQAYEDEQNIIKTGKPIVDFEEKETYKNKPDRWISTTKMPLYNENGKIIGTFGVSRDITNKKKAEEEIKKGKSEIEAVLHSTADGIYATDRKGKILLYNSKFLELWNIPKKIIDLRTYDELLEYISEQLADPEEFLRKVKKLDRSKLECIDILNFKDGRIYERSSCPLRQDNKINGRVWSFRDVTEQKKAEERIWYLSFHDKLTGLYNRAYFEEELKRLNTKRKLPLSIIFADVNGLKEMNDNYGYDRGDQLLCKVAGILKSCFRNEDVVVRWGGDEFIIVLPLTDSKTADGIIERVIEKCKQSCKKNFPVSISIGSAIKEKLHQNIDMVINTAEKRMIINKKSFKART